MKETKFKDTEVGRIPEDWEIKPIKQTCIVKRGVRVTRRMLTAAGNYPVYQNTDYPLGFYNHYNVEANTPFVIVGGSAGLIGRCNAKYWAADDCAYFTNLNGIIKDFLYYELLYLHNEIKKEVRTASIPRLDRTVIENLLMVVPSKFEQSRIATALSTIDNLISELGKLIEKKRAIKQGAMQQLLTGKKRLKGFNEPWVEYEIRNICEVKRGVRVVKNQLNTEGKFPVFQNTNMPLGYFGNYNVNECTPFVIIGGSAGQIGICYTKYWAADDCAYFECSNMILKEFLYLILLHNQKMILQNVRTGTVPRLDRSVLQKLRIRIPSNIQEQYAITNICSNMEKEVTHLEVKKAKYESIKQGMMQQLLTGKIRLK